MAKNLTRKDKNNLVTTTAAKKNKRKKNPCEESCGVVYLVQAVLALTRMYKLILCVVRDVRTITTWIQAKRKTFGDVQSQMSPTFDLLGENRQNIRYFATFWKKCRGHNQLRWQGWDCITRRALTLSGTMLLLLSRSSSRWDFHFHSYVLTIYVCLYWILELVVFYSLEHRG